MALESKINDRLSDGESVVAAVFLAEPMSTAVAAGAGGILVAKAVKNSRQQKQSSRRTISARLPATRSALAVTTSRFVAFPYQSFRGLAKEGASLTRDEVTRFEMVKENAAMRPKLVLDLADGSQWSGRLESRKGADEFAAALGAWLGQS